MFIPKNRVQSGNLKHLNKGDIFDLKYNFKKKS